MRDLVYTLFFAAVGIVIGLSIPLPVIEAQNKPFSVYQTEAACVYVAGHGATAHLAVIPKQSLYWKGDYKC